MTIEISISRGREFLESLGYPPARIATATALLLGDELARAAVAESREEDNRTHWRLVVLTASRIILTQGEGPAGWQLQDAFNDEESAIAQAWSLRDVHSLSTLPGREWSNYDTLYSSLGVTIHLVDGTDIRVPNGPFPGPEGHTQIDQFVAALIPIQIQNALSD